jgi:hypothetical protein
MATVDTGNILVFSIRFSVFSSHLFPVWSIGIISQFLDHFTDCRNPWTGGQLVVKPLPKHRTTQTQNKHIHIPNIHALCGIRTHDPGFQASEDSACLRQHDYRDRQIHYRVQKIKKTEEFWSRNYSITTYTRPRPELSRGFGVRFEAKQRIVSSP